jgi:glycosidase
MTVPSWVQDAVFYQIFPDRFFNGDPGNDPPNIENWGAEPTEKGYQGGDLKGITAKLDYLVDLGITAIYLNPIFASTANHRYHTTDYFKIDPTLGTLEDFQTFLQAAHSRKIRVILDGVFNHSGRGFFAFSDILDNGEKSRYKDWYHIHHFPVDAFGEGPATTYEAWWGIKDLPKFNTDNSEVRSYIMQVAKYWIEQGIDGWRLDVPGEIDDDQFWAEFRETVRSVNPDAYLLGEIWEADPRWVGDSHFDGLMHYPFRESLLNLLRGESSAAEFADQVESYLELYPQENTQAMFLSIGSHDTRRLITALDGNLLKVKLAFLLQFSYPGPPSIYYGDEIGLAGEKDPFNRGAFPWEQAQWNGELHKCVRELIAVRHRAEALRRGKFIQVLLEEGSHTYAFGRTTVNQQILIAFNPSQESTRMIIPVETLGWHVGQIVENTFSQEKLTVENHGIDLTLAPWEGVMIQN